MAQLNKEDRAKKERLLELKKKRRQLMLSKQKRAEYLERQERNRVNILGKSREVPAAASREAIRAKPALALLSPMFSGSVAASGVAGPEAQQAAMRGALYPRESQTFQQQAIDTAQRAAMSGMSKVMPQQGFMSPQGRGGHAALQMAGQAAGLPASAIGMGADIATNPQDVALMLAGQLMAPGTTIGSAIGRTRPGAAMTRFLTKQRVGPKQAVKQTLSRWKSDFANQELFPRLQKVFMDKLNRWTGSIQNYAASPKGGNLKRPMVNWIRDRGTTRVRLTQRNYQNSYSAPIKGMRVGFDNKATQMDKLYSSIDNAKQNVRIPMDDASKALTRFTNKMGLTKNGMLKGAPNRPAQMGTDLDDILMWQQRLRQSPSGNKFEWKALRNSLTKASYKNKGNVTEQLRSVSNALHEQANKSGFAGIKQAQEASKLYYNKIKLMKKAGLETGNVETVYDDIFTNVDKQQAIRDLDNYFGSNFLDDIKDISAGRGLSKIEAMGIADAQTGTSPIKTKLNQGVNTKNRADSKNFIEQIVGKDPAVDQIFRELATFGRNSVIRDIAGRSLLYGAAGAGIGGLGYLGYKAFQGMRGPTANISDTGG